MEKRKLEHQREVQDVVAQLRPIDDIMFQRLCENILLIEEVSVSYTHLTLPTKLEV